MAGSAINSKKKKNKNKNKNKKQSTPASSDVNSTPVDGQSTPIEQEVVEPTQETHTAQLDEPKVPPTGPVGVGAQGATDVSLAALDARDNSRLDTSATTDTVNIINVPEYIEHGIQSVVASKSIDIDGIVKKIAQNAQDGYYKEEASVQNKSLAATEEVVASDQSAFASQMIPESQTNPPAEVKRDDSFKPEVPPKSTSDSENIHDNEAVVAAATGGAGATLAGAGAVAAAKTKQEHDKKRQDSVEQTTSSSAPPPISKDTVAPTSIVPKASSSIQSNQISENVQHCIDSAIKAPAVDVYGIIQSQKGVKCPEPAAGATDQPAMPSSTKAPDVPIKKKSPERSRSKASFLKKKNCIIL
ncbi:hypothetical protein BD560DRAFT_384154 [Blakeslea trispora]|nr:hypothetical protein BD560DRAFT_384154 [Blakeslea trispora]